MSDDRPGVAIGHVRLHTSDISAAKAFYSALGMRCCMSWDGMAILELRGGTHLLLIESDDQMQPVLDPMFDLMVDDLDECKQRLSSLGIQTSDITEQERIRHRRMFVEDPDGRRIAVHSDHTEGRPV